MTDKYEAIEILNWTQRASEMWMVKLSYVSKAGSQQYAKPISKTVFRDIKTDSTLLIAQLCAMLDETLNKRNKAKGYEVTRLYENKISLNNDTIIMAEDNNSAVFTSWLMKSWNTTSDNALLLFVCGRQMAGGGRGDLSFYTTWNQMTQDNSEPYSIILKIKKVKIK